MPRGFTAVIEATDKISRSSSGGGSLRFKLDDGESAVVRFLEQGDEVYFYWYHDFTHVDKQQGWKIKFPCLDQSDEGTPCPGCEQNLPRKFQGMINVIWRDAPILKRDEEGNFVRDKQKNIIIEGNEDQVAVWRTGPELYKTLAKKDVAFKGLSSRDFEITRDGSGLDTTYSIEPADVDSGPQALSKKDKEIIREKYDLDELAFFVDYDKAIEIIGENTGNGEASESEVRQFLKKDPFED